jgi:hypothetical protein
MRATAAWSSSAARNEPGTGLGMIAYGDTESRIR